MTARTANRVLRAILPLALLVALAAACNDGVPSQQVDLSLHDARLMAATVPQGGAVAVAFTVTNESSVGSSAFMVRASVTRVGGGAATTLADFLLPPLAAGAENAVSRTATLPASASPGDYRLILEIDPAKAANLSNRADDRAELTLTVTEPIASCSAPDEVVTFADPAILAFVEARLASIGDGRMTCANVAQITQLNVSNKGVTTLAGVENLTGVYRSNLSENAITDLSPMAGMTALRELSIFGNQIANLAPLADLPLERLAAEENQLSDLGPIASMTSLTSLTIEENLLTSLAPLANHPTLKYLRAYDNQITSLAPLTTVPNLAHVDVYGNSYEAVPDLSAMTALTYLRVGGSELSDISGVAGLSAIVELAVVRSQVTSISAISGLATLERLILANNLIEDMSPLADMTGLTYVNLDSNRLTSISAAATMTGLNEFSVSGNKITDIAPIAANLGMAAGDWFIIVGNCISPTDSPVLVPPQTQHMLDIQGRGVNVQWTPVGNDAWCGRGG